MENLNIHARVTGIALRKMIEDQIPEDALRRLSLREYIYDGEWLDAVRTITRAEEDFGERKSLRGGGPSATTWAEKTKGEDSKPAVPAECVKKEYTAMEKPNYENKKAGKRKVKKEAAVAPAGEVKHTVWAEAHKGVDQKVVDKAKFDNEFTRCGMKNHTWKYCPKPGKSISCISRASEAQTRVHIHTKATPPGRHPGR